MRRTTTLFASFLLLLLGTMTAHAQSELVGKSWYIQNVERVADGVQRYMSAINGATLRLTNAPTPYEEFSVQQGSADNKIKLYNPQTNKYAGAIPDANNQSIPLVEENEAAEYTVTKLSDDSWSIVDEQGEANRNALHGQSGGYSGGDGIVRWSETESASHWIFGEYVADYYCQILSTRDIINKYISSQSINTNQEGELQAATDRKINRTNGSQLLSTLWQLEIQPDGNFLIRNANTGLCIGEIKDNQETAIEMPLDDAYAGHYALTYNSSGLMIKHGERWINALGGDHKTTIGDWASNSDSDEGNYWKFQLVTEVPVTVYSDTQWASLTLPFAAELPEGLTAYYAPKAEGDVLTLAAIEGQQIPAHTPVLLAPDVPITEDQTYQLTILYGTEVPALTAENKLEGTTAARTGFDENSLYVLASSDGTGVLKKNGTVATIPCNKSYIPASAFTNTTATPAYVSMKIGIGETTGIEGVQTATPQAEEYYDLTGRRVQRPAHGVFVTKSGQKVFIR